MNAPLAQGAALAHDSALGHVTGRAPFADDVPVTNGRVRMPEVPGVGFESKTALYAVLKALG